MGKCGSRDLNPWEHGGAQPQAVTPPIQSNREGKGELGVAAGSIRWWESVGFNPPESLRSPSSPEKERFLHTSNLGSSHLSV